MENRRDGKSERLSEGLKGRRHETAVNGCSERGTVGQAGVAKEIKKDEKTKPLKPSAPERQRDVCSKQGTV